MLTTLLLAAGLAMPSVPVCDRAELPACAGSLPPSLLQILPAHWGRDPHTLGHALSRQLAGQGAVTLTQGDQALILTDRRRIAQPHILLVGYQVYELPSVHSLELALLHEQGHLLTLAETLRTPYRFPYGPALWGEEAIADLHALWQLARRGELDQGWSLVHLRNFNLMGSAPDWAHWSTPVLLPWLETPERGAQLAGLSFDQVLVQSVIATPDLPHFRTLGRRQFGPGRGGYPYVPAPLVTRWWQMLEPSLALLMGVDYPDYRDRQYRLMMAKSANLR
ncbi:hypothetical protein SAMN04488540_102343 [Ferrimonas sediminum]|uniref:Uncharacterized protein n=1 Tax=Ferrimonas sediminum TaxID=718193 RepID=A0A1G8MD09_9GAMM|nr:hypothetical protein [Ferrimonas sediminum]SDI65767.1 hypothetical protein SAMN04488540_102343 [Ferrimonas sediminum]